MDTEFLERATEIELRLEAEGLFLTAEAIRQVVNAYVVDHSKYSDKMCNQNARKTKSELTTR
ncbi:hypothetical protein [uncultured Ruegeria sp.]|uniref:hypothetical protein n=1 Tax=uncultured Ruegeria sp. TaxID=259304 RepID=UPI002619A0E5|nr:hypothetical protein [uncultured Ruegeria sp.]